MLHSNNNKLLLVTGYEHESSSMNNFHIQTIREILNKLKQKTAVRRTASALSNDYETNQSASVHTKPSNISHHTYSIDMQLNYSHGHTQQHICTEKTTAYEYQHSG